MASQPDRHRRIGGDHDAMPVEAAAHPVLEAGAMSEDEVHPDLRWDTSRTWHLEDLGLREDPFGSALDARFVYVDQSRASALDELIDAIRHGAGVVLVSGAPGMGKTSFLLGLAEAVASHGDMTLACVEGVFPCTESTTFEDVSSACGCPQPRHGSESFRSSVLLLDDATRLKSAALEPIMRWAGDMTITVVLSATDNGKRTDTPLYRGLRAAAAVEIRLSPLNPAEVEAFVGHRLRAAGFAGPRVFTADAVERVAFYGNGNPRRITRLCGHVLRMARREMALPILPELVKEAAWDLFVPDHLKKLAKGMANDSSLPPGAGLDGSAEHPGNGAAGAPRLLPDAQLGRSPVTDPRVVLSGDGLSEPHGEGVTGGRSLMTRGAMPRTPVTHAGPRGRLRRTLCVGAVALICLLVGGVIGGYLVASGRIKAEDVAAAGRGLVAGAASWLAGLAFQIEAGLADPAGDGGGAPGPHQSSPAEGSPEQAIPISPQGEVPATAAADPSGPGASPAVAGTEAPEPAARLDQGQTLAGVESGRLVARGNRLLELGDVVSARLLFRIVAERGDGAAAMAVGRTYDPVFFEEAGIRGVLPEPAAALLWYRTAVELGEAAARDRTLALTAWLARRTEDGAPHPLIER